MSYDPSTTATLLVDPYNDFLSDDGKLWPRVKGVAEQVELLDHLREVVSTARAQGLKIFFVPHHRWKPGDYVSFDNPSPYQLASAKGQVFAKDSWGGTFHGFPHYKNGRFAPTAATPQPFILRMNFAEIGLTNFPCHRRSTPSRSTDADTNALSAQLLALVVSRLPLISCYKSHPPTG